MGKMNRMVLLYMFILSMVSLPTSLARQENFQKIITKTIDDMKIQGKDYGGFTDFLKEAVEVVGPAWKVVGPAIQKGMNAVMENLNKGEAKEGAPAGEDYAPRPSPPPLVQIGRRRGVCRNMA